MQVAKNDCLRDAALRATAELRGSVSPRIWEPHRHDQSPAPR